MQSLDHILQQFQTITLAEMDSVKLTDRMDTKYPFHIMLLPEILQEAQPQYKLLRMEGNNISHYQTLYYDTPGFSLYHKHHSGKLNRYKIRHRTYVESNLGFLEVKFSNNKGRTLKTRMEANGTAISSEEALDFLQKQLPFNPRMLVPKLWVNFKRITLVNKGSAERLTIDLKLEFIKDNSTKAMNQLVIAEVKQGSKTASPFMSIMKRKHIREASVSKYCIGVASTCNEVKTNNFKQTIVSLNKLPVS